MNKDYLSILLVAISLTEAAVLNTDIKKFDEEKQMYSMNTSSWLEEVYDNSFITKGEESIEEIRL